MPMPTDTDWTAIAAGVAAVLAIVALVVNTIQTMSLKWRQREATDAAERAAATVKLSSEKVTEQMTAVGTKLDGVVVQLDGKLATYVDEVRKAAIAAGILREKERAAEERVAVAAAVAESPPVAPPPSEHDPVHSPPGEVIGILKRPPKPPT